MWTHSPELHELLARATAGEQPLSGVAALALIERARPEAVRDAWLSLVAESYTNSDGPDRDAVIRAVAEIDPARVVAAFAEVMPGATEPSAAQAVGEFLLWVAFRERLPRPPAATTAPLFKFRHPELRYPEPTVYRWNDPTAAQKEMSLAAANCAVPLAAASLTVAELAVVRALADNDACWQRKWDAPAIYGLPRARADVRGLLPPTTKPPGYRG